MRTWLKRIRLALLIMAGLALLGLAAVNLFLNTPAASWAFNRRPERFRIEWSSAWSVWPGFVHARGLQVSGKTRNVAWSVAAERASGWIPLGPLLGRTLSVTDLHAEGVHSMVLRGEGVGARSTTSEARGGARRPPWRFSFANVSLDHVREFRFNDFRLTGDGEAAGSFWFVLGGDFRLEPSRIHMPAGQLAMGSGTFATAVDLRGEASMGPYSPRQHPGLEGFDFLSGRLQVHGRVPVLPFLQGAGIARTQTGPPGALAVDVRVERGRFLEGSRLDLTAPRPAAGSPSPFAFTAGVARGPVLSVGLEATGLALGRRAEGPPVFRSESLVLSSTTLETRLSRVFARARDLKNRRLPSNLPLVGEVRADRVQIEAPGSVGTFHAAVDHAVGRVDLAGLLARDFSIEGLQADGISARLDLAKNPGRASSPISVRIAGARLTGIRELALADLALVGDARADATFSYERDGTLTVDRTAFALPAGRLLAAGQTAAEGLSLQADVRIEPTVLGKPHGLAFLRNVSGTAALRGQISSLGFLRAYLQKAPWLSVQGQGGLTANVELDHGRLAPGTRLTLIAAPARATILDSLATGRGTMTAAVEAGKTTLDLRFDRFGLADRRQPRRPAYIVGRGLRVTATAPAALDLTAAVPDFDAVFDLPDAEVPDLSTYNILLPEETGLSLLAGRGRVRMHLAASTASRRAQGTAMLSSDAAKIQFQNLELQGRLSLRAPLVSPDLESRRFDLKGLRLDMDGITYQDIAAEAPAEPAGWWAHAQLDSGSLVWGSPVSLRGHGRIDMKNSGPLLTLFAQRSRVFKWFDDALNVENVSAVGAVRLGNGTVQIESLQATGGPLELRTRMTFTKTRKLGDLYVRYGRLAAGIELRNGERNLKLRRALEWYESGQRAWASR